MTGAAKPDNHVVAWAQGQTRLPLAARACLMLMAQKADAAGHCIIDPDTLGEALGMDGTAVRVHARALVKAGLIEVQPTRGGIACILQVGPHDPTA